MPAGPPAPAARQGARQLSGRYQLVRYIAKGGMAEVWEGYDVVLSRSVAVKMLLPHLASDGTILERFRREAVTAASLAHPGVIATFDTGVDDGTAYIVMELIRGRTLRHLMSKRGPLDPGLALRITGQITDALAYAHRSGLVHRDIKPANVLLCNDDGPVPRAKVTDFGIAKAAEGLGLDLTQTGIVLGTPKYLSPEQVEGMEPDSRADLYSLGVVLFEMLAGRAPFAGPTDMATALAHLRDEAPRVSSVHAGVPPELEDVVAGLLIKDREDRRPSTALSLRRELATLARRIEVRGPTVPQPSQTRAIAGGVGRTGPWGQPTQTPPSPGTWGPPAAAPRRSSSAVPVDDALPRRPIAAEPAAGRPVAPPPTEAAPAPPTPRAAPPRPAPTPSRGRPAPLRPHRAPGVIVACLVIAGVVVIGLLLGSSKHAATNDPPRIQAVTEQLPGGHQWDNRSELPQLYDGDLSTGWSTVGYPDRDFGRLYGDQGFGLVVQLARVQTLHSLVITTSTPGWSADVYVAGSEQPSASSGVAGWGARVASIDNASSTTTVSLGGQKAGWVLIDLTELPSTRDANGSYSATIDELTVR